MTERFNKPSKVPIVELSQSATEDTIGMAKRILRTGSANLDMQVLGSHKETIDGKEVTVIDSARLIGFSFTGQA